MLRSDAPENGAAADCICPARAGISEYLEAVSSQAYVSRAAMRRQNRHFLHELHVRVQYVKCRTRRAYRVRADARLD